MSDSLSRAAIAPVVVWMRQDLRLDNNPTVAAAAASGRPILFLYVLDDETPGAWAMGGAARWWLHQSLTALQNDINSRKGCLVLRRGRAEAIVLQFAQEVSAAQVVWSRAIEPFAVARDRQIKAALNAAGVKAESFNAQLLVEPWTLKPAGGPYFKVFSAFWRAALARGFEAPAPSAPQHLPCPQERPESEAIAAWALTPSKPDWAGGLRETWTPGPANAKARLAAFLDGPAATYPDDRNRPDVHGTSQLSAHLHFGEISPHLCLSVAQANTTAPRKALDKFIAELGWREFAHHLLFHAPDLPDANWREEFNAFPWRDDEIALRAWQSGKTGYPIVDAGMRQLWQTGWMHNRVRMIVASFLIKHLLIDWRHGQRWFWDTLVDADLANNAASWQWVAGSGADAAPYFRIFNPITQGETYDPEGGYVRKFAPELAKLPNAYIHRPWQAPRAILDDANIRLGETYPAPIVDHAEARARALAAFQHLKRAQSAVSE